MAEEKQAEARLERRILSKPSSFSQLTLLAFTSSLEIENWKFENANWARLWSAGAISNLHFQFSISIWAANGG